MPLIVTDEDITKNARLLGATGDIDVKTLSFFGIVQAAMAGDVKAFDKLMELLGEQAEDDTGQLEALIKGMMQDG